MQKYVYNRFYQRKIYKFWSFCKLGVKAFCNYSAQLIEPLIVSNIFV